MSVDKRVGSKIDKDLDRSVQPGVKIDPGPYIGIVKNNVDVMRRGRLDVWIPDLGGQEYVESHWRTVSYASPFFGSTGYFDPMPKDNTFSTAQHTYGFWMTPPDIDTMVLVIFVGGDATRGFWFACVPNTVSHHMVPAIAAADAKYTTEGQTCANSGQKMPEGKYPTTEHNAHSSDPTVTDLSQFPFNYRPKHDTQAKILDAQGLDRDTVRGPISSSSHRESPSSVFGFSTPGRALGTKDKPLDNGQGSLTKVTHRAGGHSLVMDDGDKDGKDQLVRLRTAGGHEIMMNDQAEVLYVCNSKGTAWMEFDPDGKIFFYGHDSISIRSKKDVNIHADENINIHSKKDITMYAEKDIKSEAEVIQSYAKQKWHTYGKEVKSSAGTKYNIAAGAELTMRSGLYLAQTAPHVYSNCDTAAAEVSAPDTLTLKTHKVVCPAGNKWVVKGTEDSIVKILVTHEPSPVHKTANSEAKGCAGAKENPEKKPADTGVNTTQPGSGNMKTGSIAIPTGDYENQAVELIKKEEGFRTKAYADAGAFSIGYGHQITADEIAQGYIDLGDDKVPVKGIGGADTLLTNEQGEKLLKKDLVKYENAAKGPLGNEAWGKLNDTQKAVMTSYAYNTGSTSSLVKAGLREKILAGDSEAAAEIISNKGIKTSQGSLHPGLVKRRDKEANLFAQSSVPTIG